MMRLLPSFGPLARFFKDAPESAEFQVIAHGRVKGPLTQEQLEDVTEEALDVLLDHARDLALGPIASYNLSDRQVELVFTVEATGAEDLYKRVGQIMRLLDQHGPSGSQIQLHDSTTSRLDPDREPVLA